MTSLFGKTPSFGGTSTTSTSTSGIGGSTSTGLFGNTSGTTNTTSGSLFGSNTGTSTGTGLFGTTTNNTTGGLFGSSSTTTAPSTSLFGNTSGTTTSSNLFGSTNTTNTNLFGSTTATNQTSNLTQKPNFINARSTVRQLTTIVPEWKGQFDVADILLVIQEKTLNSIMGLIQQLDSLDTQCVTLSDKVKNTLNDIKLQQDKFHNKVKEKCSKQDTQNLISIKARRLADVLLSEPANSSNIVTSFKVPNHLNVQMSKELLEKTRLLKDEIQLIQNIVQSLKNIDVKKASKFIEDVLDSQRQRITLIGDRISKLLERADAIVHKDSKKDIWANITPETSKLKRSFMEAVGLPTEKPCEKSDTSSKSDIKRKIEYLKRFNTAYKDSKFVALKDSRYNIKDLVTGPDLTSTSTSGIGGSTSTGLFGNTSGTTNTTSGSLFGSNTGTSTGTGLFGTTTNNTTGGLFGSSSTTTAPSTSLFGNTSGTTTSSNLFGSTNTTNTTSNLFGNTTQNTNTNLFGSTNSKSLFGSTSTSTNTGGSLFGSSSTNTGSSTSTGTALAIYQPNSTSSLFGSSTSKLGR
ncbi:hypothetical protein BEWA_020300 [Theileria equi strain WA]|uniref:Nucleoporin Nup54 alpha-helical domain-containing protein n=1 Tax=Theileria equi strain WA TaxID=1537102 RepID=L0AWA4_THEEQ|nr:hypothetical protein BEWA_020300 [Theileria equi strain WA]AFZ79184.1 hypothetical protein BEWA_020300 [Theileria equi strain WA]|eukprot:XP_004828850.1 hypothetical protein BEWA_020300 [Theileria equi strain WA]